MLWQQRLALPHQVSGQRTGGWRGQQGMGTAVALGEQGPPAPGQQRCCEHPGAETGPGERRRRWQRRVMGRRDLGVQLGQSQPTLWGVVGSWGSLGSPCGGLCLGRASAGVHPRGYPHSSAHSRVCSVCLQMCAQASV